MSKTIRSRDKLTTRDPIVVSGSRIVRSIRLFPISGSHDARFIPHFWESRLEGHLHGKRGLGAVKSCFPHPNQLKHEIKHQRGQIAFIIHSILSRTSPSFIKLKNQVSRIHHNLHEINNQGMLVFILGFPSILGVQEPFIKLRFY